MPRLYAASAGYARLGRRAHYSSGINKRRTAQSAGVRGRRLSSLMAARSFPIARPVVRGFVGRGAENKYFDIAAADYNMDLTGSITHLDVVTQGSTVNSRDGRKFMPTWVNMRGFCHNNPTSVGTDNAVILVWDKQPNKALAAITDVLDAAAPTAQNKRENASRFIILRRWNVVMTGKSDGSTVPGFLRNFDKFVRLPRGLIAECTPADTTGAIGNRVSGALLLITVGNVLNGNNAALLHVGMRIGFKDI